MKILHTADWHLGKKLDKFSRHNEQIEVLTEIAEIANNQDVDIVVIAGDIFDTFNPAVESVELFYRTVKKLSNYGKRPVIVIAGNHDSPDRIEAPDALALEDAIIFAGYPNAKIRQFENGAGVCLTKSDKGFIELNLPQFAYPLRVILAPDANEFRIKQFLGIENEEEALRNVLATHWANIADKYCDKNGVNIFCGHFFFATQDSENMEEEPDDEKPILHVGGAQAIFNTNLPSQIQYAALGHLHRAHTISKKPCEICYSGSPISYSFAEAQQQKYVKIVDLKPNSLPDIENIELKGGKKLIRKRFDNVENACEWLSDNQDTLVELTIESDNFLTADERRKLHESHKNIISIIPIVHSLPNNFAEKSVVDLNKNMKELFTDYFRYKKDGQNPSEEILELFDELRQ